MSTAAHGANPEVTVVIPAFNAARWIVETIDSVAAQRVDVQIIVVDDGSTDGTAEVVAQRFPEVQLIRTGNAGVSAARARGTREAHGRYLKYLDADDLLTPDSLVAQCVLAEEVQADVVYGAWQRLEELDGGIWLRGERIARRWEDLSKHPALAFFRGLWCPTGAYLWRTAFVRECHPGWHAQLPVIQDARFAFDAAVAGARFAYLDQVLAVYRTHSQGSVSTRSRRAYLLDLERHIREVAAGWTPPDECRAEYRHVLLASWAQIARNAYALDRDLTERAWLALRALDRDYIPSANPLYRAVVRAAGPMNAEAVLRMARLVREFVSGASPQLRSKTSS